MINKKLILLFGIAGSVLVLFLITSFILAGGFLLISEFTQPIYEVIESVLLYCSSPIYWSVQGMVDNNNYVMQVIIFMLFGTLYWGCIGFCFGMLCYLGLDKILRVNNIKMAKE